MKLIYLIILIFISGCSVKTTENIETSYLDVFKGINYINSAKYSSKSTNIDDFEISYKYKAMRSLPISRNTLNLIKLEISYTSTTNLGLTHVSSENNDNLNYISKYKEVLPNKLTTESITLLLTPEDLNYFSSKDTPIKIYGENNESVHILSKDAANEFKTILNI